MKRKQTGKRSSRRMANSSRGKPRKRRTNVRSRSVQEEGGPVATEGYLES